MSKDVTVETIIPLILAEFKGVLRGLGDEYGRSEEYGEPPAELFVEHNDGMRDSFTNDASLTAGRWRITRDKVESVPLDHPRPYPGERRGMFHERGYGYFSISEDRRTVWLGWQVGPRFGCGYRYNVIEGGDGTAGLSEGEMTWIS